MDHLSNNILAPLNIDRREWQHLMESGILPDLFSSMRKRGHLDRLPVRLALGLDQYPDPTTFEVDVNLNRTLTLRQMAALTQCGIQPSERVHDRSFLGEVAEKVRLTIFHFGKGRQMTYDEILEEMKAYGFRPVLVEELLALSAQHPKLQTKFPIAAIGCEEDDQQRFWMADQPATTGPRARRVDGNFKARTIYDFYRVVAVRDPKITPTKNLFFANTTAEQETVFADAEDAAMRSAYAA